MTFGPYCSLFVLLICCPTAAIGDEAVGTTNEVCIVRDPLILEASGLAVSRTTKDAVWIHNDSGDVPRLFLEIEEHTSELQSPC